MVETSAGLWLHGKGRIPNPLAKSRECKKLSALATASGSKRSA